jgi:hypothetical protein
LILLHIARLTIENNDYYIKSIFLTVNRKTIELTRLAFALIFQAMITAAQCRAARGLIDWTQQELADAARIGVATIRLFEGGAAEARHSTTAMLRQALELAGVEFIDENGGGAGVRLRKRELRRGSRKRKLGAGDR